MLKEKLRSFFKRTTILLIPFITGCNLSLPDQTDEEVSFMAIDVGQGLSQIIVKGNDALVFDMGPDDARQNWVDAYQSVGKPQIEAVIISHRDLDHSGGLRFLDSSVSWSGSIIVSRWEDTAFIREQCSNWHDPLRFRTIVQDDTLATLSDDCFIECLWPPSVISDTFPVPDDKANYYSIVCLVHFRNSRVLLTGDIDSTGERLISRQYGVNLQADLVVIPHHGSAAAVYPLFYGYIRPQTAIISYGIDNSYNHPDDRTKAMLGNLGITYYSTALNGSLLWKSNGFYWTTWF